MKNWLKRELKQKLKLQRTERFPVDLIKKQIDKFHHAQCCYMAFGNYGRKYLYHNYGYDNLFSRALPKTSSARQYLYKAMREYALRQMSKKNKVKNVKQLPYYFDRQSIDIMYNKLITNFQKYKRLQFLLKSSKNGRQAYEAKMKRKGKQKKWTGYGRIEYVHDPSHYTDFAFKANGGQSVKFINNFAVKIPYFGKIRLLQGIKKYRHRRIAEAHLQCYRGCFYILLTYEKVQERNLPHDDLNNKDKQLSLDWNQNSKSALATNTGQLLSLPNKLDYRLKELDNKYRYVCQFLDNHRNDDNVKVRYYALRERNIKRRYTNLMKDWYLKKIKALIQKYNVFAIENLASFSMRKNNKKAKGKNTKKNRNINHSLAEKMPGTFKKLCESLIPDAGKLLIEVDSYYTSKTCHDCGYVYKELHVGQEEWTCPKCKKHHQRDLNAALNILEWALHPEKHIKWLLHLANPNKNFKFLKEPDELVKTF